MTEQQTPDREKKIAEIREALEKATPGPWKLEGVQHATSGSLYEPPEPYHPAEVFVEVDDEQLISDDIVVIARLDDPMYLVETNEEGDTGERYLGSANANANLIANAPEWLGFLLSELERKDEVIEEQKRQLFYKSQEITELREKSWQDQQWFKQASANITEMQKELDRIEREYAEERAAHNAHVTELCELEQERDMYKSSSEVFYERLKKEAEQREKLVECLRFYERMARGREANDGGRRARTLLAEIGVTVE